MPGARRATVGPEPRSTRSATARRTAERRRGADGPSRRSPGAATESAALQRGIGNRAVASLLGPSGRATGPLVQRKGVISSAIDSITLNWRLFDENTTEVRGILFHEYLPMLASHTKAAGKTKNPAKANPYSSPPMIHDPEKLRVHQVARGLQEWLFSASEGAERYYAEMRQALEQFGPPSPWWQLGVSDLTEPDVHAASGISLESKRTRNHVAAGVDALIREGRAQSCRRITMPDGKPFLEWRIGVEIASAMNPWPFTSTELAKLNIAPYQVPDWGAQQQALFAQRIGARNLQPHTNIPQAQQGRHRLTVTWRYRDPPITFDIML
jgi:hypothetical protein